LLYIYVMLKSYYELSGFEAGCDEVGRGCLAGPVVAAAVILPLDFQSSLLRDSKKLSRSQLQKARDEVVAMAWDYGIGLATVSEIDEMNILNASYLAMHRALDQLRMRPTHILVDGNRFKPYPEVPHTCMIKGDNQFYSIAAASVLAKTYRDDWMWRLSQAYSYYGWQTNVGYPTPQHRKGIRQYGTTVHHRKSFTLLPGQKELFDKTKK